MDNVTFQQVDAQTHSLPDQTFDLAISRHGVMFFADPVTAFANIARALRPGGRIVWLTWQPFDRNEWLRSFYAALAAGRELPTPPTDAVAASCASSLPYRVGDSRYVDGGYRRNENADLAVGYGRVLVLSPFGGRTRHPLDWGMQLAAQVEELRARGSRFETIFPDSDAEHMFGVNAMDPSLRPPAARAGYNQGRARAEQLTEFWCKAS